MGEPSFAAGRNIAMKVPPHQYDATVAFYRDVLGFHMLEEFAPAVAFEFGANRRSSPARRPNSRIAGRPRY